MFDPFSALSLILEVYDRIVSWRESAAIPPPKGSHPGIADRVSVFGESPIEGQVFAIEVLERPVRLRRTNGQVTVDLNRQGVESGVYTNAGKKRLVADRIEDQDYAKQLDREIHEFILGSTDQEVLEIPLSGFRWGSGGVLAHVKWRGKWWSPFFFRDIPPVGWNIPLGASEQPDNLNLPWTFAIREFLEEVLVVKPLDSHAYGYFSFGKEEYSSNAQLAKFTARHRGLRSRDINLHEPRLGIISVGTRITNMKLSIVDQGASLSENVIVTINPTELGIECIHVLEFDLDDDAFILDGEMLEPAGSNPVTELVRMPVALISHDYLHRASQYWQSLEYENGMRPSVLAPQFQTGDIHVFSHDVERRKELANSGTEWEKSWYSAWVTRYSKAFENLDEVSTLPCSFTPAAAKAATYWFACCQ